MSYRLPPLNGLRAFEAAARHLSFRLAANELCVTPGAVSQQVKSLEESLGVKLFDRLPRGLILKPDGEAYLSSISTAFRTISEATEVLAPALRGRKFCVGIDATLSGMIELLSPNLSEAGIRLDQDASMQSVLDGQIDAILRPYLPRHPNLILEHFDVKDIEKPITLAISPGLAGCYTHRSLIMYLRILAN